MGCIVIGFTVALVTIFSSYPDHNIINGGFVLILVGLVALGTDKGVDIDYRNKRYKTYVLFLLWKIGKWKILPALKRVEINYQGQTEPYRIREGVLGDVALIREFVLLLITDSGKGIIVSISKNRDEISEDSKVLSDILNLPIKWNI